MSMIKSVLNVSFFTFCSRILGFVRECLFSAFLGITSYLDCFFIAVKLANTCRKIFAEGAFNAAFLPKFSNVLENRGFKQADILLSKIFSLMVVSLTIFSIIVIAFYPQVLSFIASGFKSDAVKFGMTVHIGRLMFPFLFFVSITALFCGVSNAIKKFALPAIIYTTVNIFSIIIVSLCFVFNCSIEQSVFFLSLGVPASGFTQVTIMWFYLKKHSFNIRFTLDFFSPEIKEILLKMIPGLIGAGVWQINMLVDTQVCSYFPSGTISILNFADKLNQFPLAMVGTAIGTVMLPTLTSSINKKDFETANKELQNGVLFALFFALFATVCLFVLSQPIVSSAYERLKFTSEHVVITSMALQGFVIGLPANVLNKIFAAAFFANGDTSTPVKCAVIVVFLNLLFILLLVPFGLVFCVPLSTSLASITNTLLLWYLLKKKHKFKMETVFFKKLFVQLLAAMALFFELQFICRYFWDPVYGSSYLKWIHTISYGCISIISYSVFIVICLRIVCAGSAKKWYLEAWSVR